MRMYLMAGLLAFSTLLSGCAATEVLIAKHDLDVQTKESSTIFLDPVPDVEKTIYVQIKNTSDQPDFDVTPQVVTLLSGKGYKVVHSLDEAHYLLQANILQVGKTDQTAAQAALKNGYGGGGASMLLTGATAAVGASLVSNSGKGIMAAGLLAGVGSMVADNLVKDVVYSAIIDVQISERTKGNVTTEEKSSLKQGLSNLIHQSSTENSSWQKYQTRVVSTAEKANLDFSEALPKLETGLSHALAGIF